jgi:iron complex transport system ATP-binding protein
VILDGTDIARLRTKDVARRLGLLPQSSIAPEGITVADLVTRGRFPHQTMLRQFSRGDQQAVAGAMAATGVTSIAGRPVDELSGGQRQRVWIAMVLAQQTPLMLLDEPTTFLDIAHQIELLELFAELNAEQGRTIVAVLHDLNHACRFADQIIAMKAGSIVAQGNPSEVITASLVEEVYGLKCQVIDDPETGTPLVIPRASSRLRARKHDGSSH